MLRAEPSLLIDTVESVGKEIAERKVVTIARVDELIRLSKRKFGHTFIKHGMTSDLKTLSYEARATGENVGQWLDDQRAAQLILAARESMVGSSVKIPIPIGLGRFVTPEGKFVAATHAVIVRGTRGTFVTTAYPVHEAFILRQK